MSDIKEAPVTVVETPAQAPPQYQDEKSALAAPAPAPAAAAAPAPAPAPVQQAPVQVQQQQHAAPLVLPLYQLGDMPAMVDCPKCKTQVLTRVEQEIGQKAWLVGLIICVAGGGLCAWIPCVLKSFKDHLHFCSKCNLPLAVVQAGGRVTIAQPAMAMEASKYTP